MTDQLLLIFYKNPELGKVKTRLAATIGEEKALAIYLALVKHTREITEHLACDKLVCYADFIDTEDAWSNQFYKKELQRGRDLGARISGAFENGFGKGYKSVVIIGTDCPELTSVAIEAAFHQLGNHDAVLGPAEDGGYYLLGTRAFYPRLFQNKIWSSSTVARDTLADLSQLKLSVQLLPTLSDIDEEKDLKGFFLH
jgi:uncharacterized protein